MAVAVSTDVQIVRSFPLTVLSVSRWPNLERMLTYKRSHSR